MTITVQFRFRFWGKIFLRSQGGVMFMLPTTHTTVSDVQVASFHSNFRRTDAVILPFHHHLAAEILL